MDKKKVVAAVGDEDALFLLGNHTNHEDVDHVAQPGDEMETDEAKDVDVDADDENVMCKSDENVVFSKEAPLVVKERGGCTCNDGSKHKSGLITADSGVMNVEKCAQEKKLSRQDRIEVGRLYQGAVSSHDWERAESLILLADPQTLNDALCISLDSIWFLSTHQELDGITRLITTIICNGASDFTRAALRTSFLASCVSACQSQTMSLADTVSVMAQR